MYGLEIVGSICLCIFLSGLAFLVARKSFVETEIILPKDDVKQKSKPTKKVQKVKVAKKESSKPKDIKKVEEVKVEKIAKKDINIEKSVKIIPVVAEKITADSSIEWTKITKPAKKVNKKEQKENVEEQPIVVEESLVEAEKETLKKSKKSKKEDTLKSVTQKSEYSNELKTEEKDIQLKIKEKKVLKKEENNIVEEIKVQSSNEETDLRRKMGELSSEFEKQRNIIKEENRLNLQTINQLNKDLDALKQKIKLSQMNEEKVLVELEKKNDAAASLRQQFVIVQSELTKNIVQVQSINREKEKLENRFKLLEEESRQLREINEKFDDANSEKEMLADKLARVEDDFRNTKIRYNELFQSKEKDANERINRLESEKQSLQDQLVRVQKELIDNNSTLQHMQQELLKSKSAFTEILNENVHLQSRYTELERAYNLIQQEHIVENSLRDQKNKDNIAETVQKCHDLQEISERLKEEKEILAQQCRDSATNHIEENKLREQVSTLSEELSQVKELLNEKCSVADMSKKSCEEMIRDMEGLRKEKEELLNTVEQNKVMTVSKEELLTLQSLFEDQEITWSQRLAKVQSDSSEKVNSLTQELNTLRQIISEKESDKESFDDLVSKIEELKSDKESLNSLVEQYKAGLQNTESILSKLQASVNEEENKWRESLLKSESEAEKCSKELEKVHNELMRIRNLRVDKTELNFAYHCVDKSLSSLIDEMEARMNHFETCLEAVIQERDSALAQVSVQMNGTTTKEHVNNIGEESEISKIKEDLVHQVEVNQSLEMHCNKYQALIEIGKDALEAEKSQVQNLKEELKLLQSKLSEETNHDL